MIIMLHFDFFLHPMLHEKLLKSCIVVIIMGVDVSYEWMWLAFEYLFSSFPGIVVRQITLICIASASIHNTTIRLILFTDFKEEYEILSDITVLHIFLFFFR